MNYFIVRAFSWFVSTILKLKNFVISLSPFRFPSLQGIWFFFSAAAAFGLNERSFIAQRAEAGVGSRFVQMLCLRPAIGSHLQQIIEFYLERLTCLQWKR